eukprot:6298312-Prymnesium_polylepis.1
MATQRIDVMYSPGPGKQYLSAKRLAAELSPQSGRRATLTGPQRQRGHHVADASEPADAAAGERVLQHAGAASGQRPSATKAQPASPRAQSLTATCAAAARPQERFRLNDATAQRLMEHLKRNLSGLRFLDRSFARKLSRRRLVRMRTTAAGRHRPVLGGGGNWPNAAASGSIQRFASN